VVFAQPARDRQAIFVTQPEVEQHQQGRINHHQLEQRLRAAAC
jgi:hypothetical protein